MGFFPLYRESLLTGPSHVSFSLPGIPSGISKSIGLTSSALLLIPNIDFLKKFIEGDLGISDSTWKASLFKNINSVVSSTQESVFRKFLEVNDLKLGGLPQPGALLNNITSQASSIKSNLVNQGTSIVNNVTGQVTTIGGSLINQGTGVFNNITSQASTIGGGLVNQGTGLFNNITGQASTIGGELVNQGTGLFNNITGQASTIGGGLLTNITSQASTIGGGLLTNITGQAGTIGSNLIQGVNLNNGNVGSNILNNLTGQGSNILNNLTGQATTIGGGILTNITGQGTAIVSNLTSQSTSILNNFTGQASGIASNLTNQATSQFSNLKGKGIGITNDIIGQAGTIGKDLADKGNNILNSVTGKVDLNKYKKNGKFKLPLSEIKISSAFDGAGLKAFEKSTLQSIFETQKPYMEIAKTVLSLLVDIEDIVARVMPLASVNPLKHKSEKPTVNSGGNGAKAVGYQSGKDIKVVLAKLGKISKQGGKITVNKDGSVTKPTINKTLNDNESELDPNTISANEKLVELSKSYKIINVVYSTKYYDPKIDYVYKYIDLPSDPEIPEEDTPEDDDTDPYNKYKPKKIVFGIFNSKGVPINPEELLKTVGYSGNQITQVTTSYKRAEWLIKSTKWMFRNGEYIWPTFGTPNYVFSNGFSEKVAKTTPESGNLVPSYSLKKYKEGDKNLLTDSDAFPGDPVINGFDGTDVGVYTRYFTEYTTINLKLAKDLEQQERDEATQTIMSQLNVNSHLENVFNYGQNKSSTYKGINGKPAFPEVMKLSFQPYQIYVAEAEADEKLKGLNGMIWIDPESDYDMKVVRIDPVTKIVTNDAKSEPDLGTTIKSFIKNKYIIQLSGNSKFNIDVFKNNVSYDSQVNISEYVLENWNYENLNLVNTNVFRYRIWSETPIYEYQNSSKSFYTWSSSLSNNTTQTNNNNATNNSDQSSIVSKSIKKEGNNWVYTELNKSSITGDVLLGDSKTNVYVENGIIKKWYYDYDVELSSNQTKSFATLPAFGKQKTVILNSKIGTYTSNEIDTPIYQLKVTDLNNPNGSIIDPSKITNENLQRNELFSTGKYGVGDPDNPQEIEILKRYQITDLDTESYYIIEGIRVDLNNQDGDNTPGGGKTNNASGGSGSKWYRLPHAIGAITVFIKLLIKVFAKLIPSITKLINLFKNPMSFITDIISEKLGDSFTFLSKTAFKKYSSVSELIKKRDQILKEQGGAGYVNMIKEEFKNSPLKNYMFINNFGNKISNMPVIKNITDKVTNLDNLKGMATNLLGGKIDSITTFGSTVANNLTSKTGLILNNITGQATTIGTNLFNQGSTIANNLTGQATTIGTNLFNQATTIGGNLFNQGSTIANNLTGQATTIGTNLFNQGTNIANNLTSQTSTIVNGVSNEAKKIANNLNKNKLIPPILKEVQGMGDFKNILDGVGFIPFSIFGKDLSFGMELKFGNLMAKKLPLKLIFNKEKKSKEEGTKDKVNKIPSEDKTNSQATDPNQFDKGNVSGGTKVNTNTTGKNTNPENVYQIVSTWYSTGQFIKGVDYNYIYITLDNEQLLNEVEELESSDNPDDVLLAKEKLEEAIKKSPNDESLKTKLKDVKGKLFDLAANVQPILKLILSLVTLPVKVIADIVKYIMDFFKSLTNPITLPSKIAEFLSFKWIMDFFTPKGILEILGLKFKPELIAQWVGMATMAGAKANNIKNNIVEKGSNIVTQGTDKFNSLKGQGTDLTTKIVGQGTNILNNVTGQASAITNNLTGQTGAILNNITGQATTIGTNLFNQGSSIANNLTGQATTIGGNLFNQGSTIANNLTGQATTIGTNLFNQGTNIANNLTGQATTIGTNLFNQGTNIANNLTGQATAIGGNLFNQGTNIANNLTGQATTIGTNLFNQGTNIANNLTGQATTIGTNLFNQGTNIASNLTNKGTKVAKDLTDKAANLTDKATNIGDTLVGQGNNIASKAKGFLYSDDFELADLSKFFSAPFIPTLPTYTASHFRDMIKNKSMFPFKLFLPSVCLIESIVNGFIDFIWSTLGLEILIKPPHIKLCSSTKTETMNALDIQKTLNGELPSSSNNDDNTTEITSTVPLETKVSSDQFIYEVKLQDGSIKTFLDREGLDNFMEEHKDINFDLEF